MLESSFILLKPETLIDSVSCVFRRFVTALVQNKEAQFQISSERFTEADIRRIFSQRGQAMSDEAVKQLAYKNIFCFTAKDKDVIVKVNRLLPDFVPFTNKQRVPEQEMIAFVTQSREESFAFLQVMLDRRGL